MSTEPLAGPPPEPPASTPNQPAARPAGGAAAALGCQRVLVPIDLSEHSATTLDYAARLAVNLGTTLVLFHVFEIPQAPAGYYPGRHLRLIDAEAAKADAIEKLSGLRAGLEGQGRAVEAYCQSGFPYEAIIAAAAKLQADLIVIGSHGYSGLKQLLLGSTAERVVRYAGCPVLVVKGRSGP